MGDAAERDMAVAITTRHAFPMVTCLVASTGKPTKFSDIIVALPSATTRP